MINKNPIINITFEEATVSILSILAEYKHTYSARLLVHKLDLEPLDIPENFKVTEVNGYVK